ncbi:Conjugative transfer protein TrbF [Candidatus Paraburkholderia calva]|nr:Conjugative transfer protein TrbF [Candidatus Paraburkholderia calva]
MSIFRRPAAHYGKTPEPTTPYQRTAQAWDERIGSARVQARNWRLMAFGSLALSAGFAGGLIWQSANGSIVPLGGASRQARAGAGRCGVHGGLPSDRRAGRLVSGAADRGDPRIPADPIVLRQNWLRANDPFTKVGRMQVSVEVSSVIRASPDSFRVAWIERRYQDGSLAATERWSAIVTVSVNTPGDTETLRKNPLGIFITAIDWSRELGQ